MRERTENVRFSYVHLYIECVIMWSSSKCTFYVRLHYQSARTMPSFPLVRRSSFVVPSSFGRSVVRSSFLRRSVVVRSSFGRSVVRRSSVVPSFVVPSSFRRSVVRSLFGSLLFVVRYKNGWPVIRLLLQTRFNVKHSLSCRTNERTVT